MRQWRQAVLAIAILGGAAAPAGAQGLEVGAVAPDFTLTSAGKDGVGKAVKLSDYKGQTVVLAFFPKARTSGCTVQNDAYRDQYAKLFNGGKGVTLFSVSVDAPEELAAWAKDRNYPHRFLSDKDGVVGKPYGAYNETYKLDMRVLYVIGPDGKVAYKATPFRETDPTAYTDLAAAIAKAGSAAKAAGTHGDK